MHNLAEGKTTGNLALYATVPLEKPLEKRSLLLAAHTAETLPSYAFYTVRKCRL